jgi:hypothetical protein
VAIFPKEKEKEIIDAIPVSVQLHPKTFTDFLSVAFLKGKYHLGLASKDLFFYPGMLLLRLPCLCCERSLKACRKRNSLRGETEFSLACSFQT